MSMSLQDETNETNESQDSIFQLSMWVTGQLNECTTRIANLEHKIEKLEEKISSTRKEKGKSLHISIDKKIPPKKTRSLFTNINTSPKLMILISQHGIKWVIQGDTYSFRSVFHNYGCIWDKKLNGWVIYTRNTLDHITDMMNKKCPSIEILWN